MTILFIAGFIVLYEIDSYYFKMYNTIFEAIFLIVSLLYFA